MSNPTAPLTAQDILDAIATKYSKAVLLQELTVADHDHDALVDQWVATGQAAGLPYPTGAVRRIDALLLEGTIQRTAIEVKISRADFRKETHEKRRAWERITDRFVYACPANLIQPDEIPPHCGLWWIGEDRSVTIMARAQKNRDADPLPYHLTVTLAYRLKRFQTAANRHHPPGPALQGMAAKRVHPTDRRLVSLPGSRAQ